MDIQGVPRFNILSVVHSKHIDVTGIEVVDNDIVLMDTESVISFYDGPSKMEMLTIGLCLQGESVFSINLREHRLLPGSMVVVLPNQIIEHHSLAEDYRGIFLAVSKQVLESIPKVANMLSLFFFLKNSPCFVLKPEEQEVVVKYHSFIRERLHNHSGAYRKEVAMGLVQGFFFELCSMLHKVEPDVTAPAKTKSRKEFLFERFYETLIESYQAERSVRFYADRLCLTPKHLSGVVKEVSGKTVGEWIDDFVILEAKALLNSSSLSIQEISDRLNFANQSFFGKYFKHYTGMSPKEYRSKR